jgi:hypothetical protein
MNSGILHFLSVDQLSEHFHDRGLAVVMYTGSKASLILKSYLQLI